MIRLLLAAFFLFCLSSCSTLKDEDCENRDWKDQGFRDASKGYSPEMYQTYLKVCEQSETKETLELFQSGYQEGALKYCTFEKGILVGEAERPYPKVCPKEKFSEFHRGFLLGKKKALKRGPIKKEN